jgi:hypothetical protein
MRICLQDFNASRVCLVILLLVNFAIEYHCSFIFILSFFA